jgi:DNA repair exonuclease SbcCD nuclease subunit
MARKMKRTVILGDFHSPWFSRPALAKAIELIEAVRPDFVVQAGDLYDFYSFSRYARSHNVITPALEVKQGRKHALEMWNQVRRASPSSKCFQIRGNHDVRAEERVAEALPVVESLLNVRELFLFDGVETIMDPTEELILDGVVFQHGFRSKLGDHAKFNQRSTVVGHSHTGGVVFYRNFDGIYWELNAGWLGDETAPVFRYRPQNKLSTWTRGAGLIDELGPRFVLF